MKEFKKHTEAWKVTGMLEDLKIVQTTHETEEDEITEQIAIVRGFGHHLPGYAQAYKNAKLMAAAPQMLDALHQIQFIAESLPCFSASEISQKLHSNMTTSILQKCKDMILLAEGKGVDHGC